MIIKVSTTARQSDTMTVSRSYAGDQLAKVTEFIKNDVAVSDIRFNGKTLTFVLKATK